MQDDAANKIDRGIFQKLNMDDSEGGRHEDEQRRLNEMCREEKFTTTSGVLPVH